VLTKPSRWCFVRALEDENDIHNLPVWQASQWTNVHVASLHRRRGRELLTQESISKQPAIASQSRVFC
jgi:hypothetical protein